jgi:TRAP-type transport system periplasmic protein
MKVLLIAALVAAGAAHAQTTTWKLATGYRGESFHTQNIQQFAAEVELATSGQLKIEVHPNNSLFKLGEIRQAVQDGKGDAGETIMSGLVKDIPIDRPIRNSSDIAGTHMRTYNQTTVRIAELLKAQPVDVAMVLKALAEGRMDNMITSAVTGVENQVWGSISMAVMVDSTNELRAGIKIERVSSEFESEIKRFGEKFSREWVRLVGNEANDIFIPYYMQ